MTRKSTRRQLLGTSTAAGTLAYWNSRLHGRPITLQSPLSEETRADNYEIERVADLIQNTEPSRVVEIVLQELQKGLSTRQFLAANFFSGIRYHGHHNAYVAHAVQWVCQSVPSNDELLPLFYYLGVLKFRQGKPKTQPIDKSNLPSIAKADGYFHAAMDEDNPDLAARSLLTLARENGPQSAYQHLWKYAAERNHNSGGHAAISIANTYRTLNATGWACAETALQFAVQDEAYRKPGGSQLHSINRERAKGVRDLARDWSGGQSRKTVVVELLDLYRRGRPDEACAYTAKLLRQNKIQAQTVWDAVFLTTAEMVTRYRWTGPKMLAGHSVTCANALHFMFRTVSKPVERLYALLEAVEWTASFVDRERARLALRERNLLDLPKSDAGQGPDVLEQIFALLPPRRFVHFSRERFEDVDRACELTFAWAKGRFNHRQFLDAAQHRMCRKSTPEVHDFKFPVALFENTQHVSPIWKPYLLAASVYVLHGSVMEDSVFVQQAQELLQ